jgi:hypothetical protein
MLELTDESVSYFIVSPARGIADPTMAIVEASRAQSLLYSRDYSLISLTGYSGGVYDRSYLAYGASDNESLREDAMMYIREMAQREVLVKYSGSRTLTILSVDGSEYPVSIRQYDGGDDRAFIHEGQCFSVRREKRYRTVESRSEIRRGMTLEYFNNDRWNEVVVSDPDTEFERMYRLLIKYSKLRVCID